MKDKPIYRLLADTIVVAGKRLLNETAVVNSHKNTNDLLTQNDLDTERFIVETIRGVYPDINIISEETMHNTPLNGISVVLDPIDGTCNFSAGNNLFGVQIALFNDLTCIFSAIYLPFEDKLFLAYENEGAYLNGKRIFADRRIPQDGILLISDYYEDVEISVDKQFELIKSLRKEFLKIRHFGAACVDFAMLVEKKAVAYISYYNKLWDIAPGLLMAKEVGLFHQMLDGGTYSQNKTGLVVANNQETLDLIIERYKGLCY